MGKFCIHCGVENQDEALFCAGCGSKFDSEEINQDNNLDNPESTKSKDCSFSLFSFSGCVSRQTYWVVTLGIFAIPFLIVLAIGIAVGFSLIFDAPLKEVFSDKPFNKEILIIPILAISVLMLWISISISIKRLRDAGFSAWWYLLVLIPYLGAFIIFIMNAFVPSVKQNNKYCKSRNNLSSNVVKWFHILFWIPIALLIFLILLNDTDSNDSSYEEIVHKQVTNMTIKNVWLDKTTGLMWQDDEHAKTVEKPWITQANYDAKDYMNTSGDTATTYCSNLSLARHNDWRLPTKEELKDLFEKKNNLKNVSSSGYWSSTTNEGYKYGVWVVFFYNGYVDSHYKDFNYYVRCVRAGQ